MNKTGFLVACASFALLATATVAIVLQSRHQPVRRFHGELTTLLPEAPPGWTRTVRPVAETVEMQNTVSKILKYDDAVFVDYARGGDRVSLYIAYWTPDKISYRMVAGHTPDVCWVNNGWRRTSPIEKDILTTKEGRTLPPAEFRTFDLDSHTEHVWFWHLVGERVFSYDTGGLPPWYAMFSDLFRRDFDPRAEQFFIRLSATASYREPQMRPAFDAILGKLPIP